MKQVKNMDFFAGEINMPDYEKLQVTIARIQRMERYLDKIIEVMNTCPSFIKEDAAVREMLQELTDYYENGQWLQDYDCDARGELPADLKRGVLAQDTLYELLCKIGEYRRWMSICCNNNVDSDTVKNSRKAKR